MGNYKKEVDIEPILDKSVTNYRIFFPDDYYSEDDDIKQELRIIGQQNVEKRYSRGYKLCEKSTLEIIHRKYCSIPLNNSIPLEDAENIQDNSWEDIVWYALLEHHMLNNIINKVRGNTEQEHKRNRNIVCRCLGIGKYRNDDNTFTEVAEAYNISKTRPQQILNKCKCIARGGYGYAKQNSLRYWY